MHNGENAFEVMLFLCKQCKHHTQNAISVYKWIHFGIMSYVWIVRSFLNNETPINIFLDLSKAFDTIDHNILLDKLNYYRLDDTAIQLFRSYLTNRYQYIQIENAKSQLLEINTGIPQGSILGPLLFIIYINDISQSSDKLNFLAYADDTTLSTTLNKFSTSHDMNISDLINLELYNINEWLEINKLSLNKQTHNFTYYPNQQYKYRESK